ncbi:MAG: 2OG-Fe(II) oxygenase [Pseudomonadota bacterium]
MADARVNPAVTARTGELAREFVAGQPFRHLVIDEFFDPAFAEQLEAAFPSFDAELAVNEDGAVGGKAVHERLPDLGGPWAKLHELSRSRVFLDFIGALTDIDKLQFDPWYFGGGTHENRHGQDLDPHVDFNYHPITRQHRRLNLIVYFEQDWAPAWGGALDLHRNPRLAPDEDEIKRVPVAFNRAVLFETTESSWHGFERIELPDDIRGRSRRSFALYFYTDERPAAETAKPHSTIYVERHLPDRFRPGMVLGEADVAELHTMLGRRDQHLERLYRHISDLTARVEPRADGERIEEDLSELSPEELVLRLAASEQARDSFEDQIAELYRSTSWRLTAPLRALRRLFVRNRDA